MTKTLSTLEIAEKAKPVQIYEIAKSIGIRVDELKLYGNFIGKVSLKVLDRVAERAHGKLICVTGMTPTKEGDGKTCTSIALTQALGRLKKKVILCLREPSLSPIFGYKGGAAGGGFSQVLPMDDINLHFTGDIHAIEIAHNLLASIVENHVHHGNALGVDPENIFWRRTLDICDRQLRDIIVGLSKASHFPSRKTGFDITAASEVMAALSLSTSIRSLKSKLAKISVALTKDGRLITAEDLKAVGAMALLMKDAVMPNLVQTLEGQPVFIHTGPFANVSHGNNSLLATTMALKLANFVVTESGFASDLGLEKLFDIVCREGRLKPSVVVMVVSVKAIKSHAPASDSQGPMSGGFENIKKHLENIRQFGVAPVVAINRFPVDTDAEIKQVTNFFATIGVDHAVHEGVRLGGEGAVELAEKVLKVITEKPSDFKPLYDLNLPIEEKIETLAVRLYGAEGVTYTDEARQDLERIRRFGLDALPICVAKTPYSLSDDLTKKGAPTGWKLRVGGVRAYTGAGFNVVLCGNIMLMPGLPEKPVLERMNLLDDGRTEGLF